MTEYSLLTVDSRSRLDTSEREKAAMLAMNKYEPILPEKKFEQTIDLL